MFAAVVRAAPLRATSRAMAPQLKFQPGFHIFTPETLPSFLPSIAGWGAAATGFVTLYLSGVPKFKEDVLSKLPLVCKFWVGTLRAMERVSRGGKGKNVGSEEFRDFLWYCSWVFGRVVPALGFPS